MPKRNLAWMIVIVVIALLMWQLPQIIAGRDSVYRAFGPLVDVRAQIRKRYVKDVKDDELIEAAVNAGARAMVQTLRDPYAIYLDEKEYERFRDRTQGVFGGIGVEVWATDEGLEILSREPNSPASVAGLLPADVITHIDGHATGDIPFVEAVDNYLNGPPGSLVKLTVRRPDLGPAAAPLEFTLTRSMIQLDPVRGWSRESGGAWRYMLDEQGRIGYIRLTKFTANAATRIDAEMDRLLREDLHGLILDLRENTGGLLREAIDVADCFLHDGKIVSTRGRRTSPQEWFATREGTYPDSIRMAVLVNGSTASAAEIVAGALRDNKRAVVVGERSYGKGSVQEVVEVSPLDRRSGALKLTTAYYYLPGGECIQRTPESQTTGDWGVIPNVPVDLTKRQRAKWLTAWRTLGRETASDTATQPGATTAAARAGLEREDALRRLMDADPQLRKAVEILRGRITGSATTGPSDTSENVLQPAPAATKAAARAAVSP